jgi:hypothetical protein
MSPGPCFNMTKNKTKKKKTEKKITLPYFVG